MKVLVKLFQKLVGAGDTAGRLRRGEKLLAAPSFAKLFFSPVASKKSG